MLYENIPKRPIDIDKMGLTLHSPTCKKTSYNCYRDDIFQKAYVDTFTFSGNFYLSNNSTHYYFK